MRALPIQRATRSLFTRGETLYLFSAEAGDRRGYKIFEQDRGAQTAKERYELEEHLSRDDLTRRRP